MTYFKKIIGEKCYLSPISVEDAEKYCVWLNDVYTASRMQIAHAFLNIDKEKEAIENLMKQGNHLYGIIDLASDQLIGNVGLHDIDLVNRTAMFGIFVGNPDFRGKGYGTEATRLILDFAFNILNLHSVYLWVFSFNEYAKKIYERVGFKEQGQRREAKIVAGKYYDMILMDILESEFDSPYVKATIVK